MAKLQAITPCLWFDSEAEQAANFYIGIFRNSRIRQVTHYAKAGQEIHGRKPGSVMVVEFELSGQLFRALNGGPIFKFNEAISLQVECDTQDEIDYYSGKLSHDPKAEQCGWVKDKYGLSWQIVPTIIGELFKDPVTDKTERAMAAMMQMHKLDIAALKKAYAG